MVIDCVMGCVVGMFVLMCIDLVNGVIEVGFVMFLLLFKCMLVLIEVQFLLMKYVFDMFGYWCYEWKCDDLNVLLCKVVVWFGFCYEGMFWQVIVYCGCNCDIVWFLIIDGEWLDVCFVFEVWFVLENFDVEGNQCQLFIVICYVQVSVCDVVSCVNDVMCVMVCLFVVVDEVVWWLLWQGYQKFYDMVLSDVVFVMIWVCLMDLVELMFVFGVFDVFGVLVGIVYLIYYCLCWIEGLYCYLQDLYMVFDVCG